MVGNDVCVGADLGDRKGRQSRDAAKIHVIVVGACRSRGGEVKHGVSAEASGIEGEGVRATTAQQDVVAAKPIEQVGAVEAARTFPALSPIR